MKAIDETLQSANVSMQGKIYTLIGRMLNPSVVHIDTERRERERPDEISALRSPRARRADGQASGVIVEQSDGNGYIVTNFHVVDQAASITVNLNNGKAYDAELVGTDPKNDLAVLKIKVPSQELIAAHWGDSSKLEVGELVWAMGNPFGLDNSLTSGIVSAVARRGVNQHSQYQEYLQTDAAVNPGNSGGPLVNSQCEIVGINTAIVGPTYQGISFAIPSNIVRKSYEEIRTYGKVSNGFLGVGLSVVPSELSERYKLEEETAALVTTVRPRSPAAQAGIRPGDIILKWDGKEIKEGSMLSFLIARTKVGSVVDVEIIRDGRPITLQVTVGERPTTL
jgi:S1-C subfamily serine protease